MHAPVRFIKFVINDCVAYMTADKARIAPDVISALTRPPAEGKILAHVGDRIEHLAELCLHIKQDIGLDQDTTKTAATDLEQIFRNILEVRPSAGSVFRDVKLVEKDWREWRNSAKV